MYRSDSESESLVANEEAHAHSVPYFLQAAGLRDIDFRKFKRITGRKEVLEEDKEQDEEDQDDDSEEDKNSEEDKINSPIEDEGSVSVVESQYQMPTNFNEIGDIGLIHQKSAPLGVPERRPLSKSDSSNTLKKAKIKNMNNVSCLWHLFNKLNLFSQKSGDHCQKQK